MSAPQRPYNHKRPYVEDDHDDQSRRRHDRDVIRAQRRRGGEDHEYDQRKRRAQDGHRDTGQKCDQSKTRPQDGHRDRDQDADVEAKPSHQHNQQQKPHPDDDDALDADLTFELTDEEEEERRIQEQRRKRQQLMQQFSSEHPHTQKTSSPPDAVPLQKEPQAQAQLPSQADTSQGQVNSAPQDISAADYDPSMDRNKASKAVADGIGEPQDAQQSTNGNDSEYEEVEVEEDDDDVDDMFAIPDDSQPAKKKTKVIRRKKASNVNTAQLTSHAPPAHNSLTDNWDDSEGYYRIVLGERIGPNGRYHVFANLGKGMFSEVVRAKDVGPDGKGLAGETHEVAIKIVRSQQTMYKAGQKEISILTKLSSLDPQDKRHIVRLVSHFEHRGHLCMVFESLSMNLRDVVKRFGKDVGLNLRAVKAYTSQILLGLSLMKRAEIMHADLKPDNILVNESKTVLKICDLGSATSTTDMEEITPYLVSRFYRAPEIILGGSYDCALDMWSIGCTLYELYTGKILFPGKTNNQMLLLMQQLKGKFTTKQIRKGKFSSEHFDDNNTFLSKDVDANGTTTSVERVTTLTNQPRNDLRSRLLPPRIAKTLPNDELKATQHFLDLLNRMLELDPAKRITPNDALKHPFLAAA